MVPPSWGTCLADVAKVKANAESLLTKGSACEAWGWGWQGQHTDVEAQSTIPHSMGPWFGTPVEV